MARPPPQVQHSFDGDGRLLNATIDTRITIRKGLIALAQELYKHERQPIQIIGDIQIKVGGPDAKLNNYSINVTDHDFDKEHFDRQVPHSHRTIADAENPNQILTPAANLQNGRRMSSTTPVPRARDETDEVAEIRHFKRRRPDDTGASTTPQLSSDLNNGPMDIPDTAVDALADKADQLLKYMKDWHEEWVRQGGWLFDNVSKVATSSEATRRELEKKMEAVQDVLGQSMNSASSNILTELANVGKLAPWLEHCRKTNEDQRQAREEKWRSSSATFHDQARRERESAERRMEKRLDEQFEILKKLADANGIDLDDAVDLEAGSRVISREESLGAQLTRELNTASESNDQHETSNGESGG